MMNKRKVWFFPMVLYVLLLDPEEVVQEKTHVTELAELGNSADFPSAGTGTDSIVIDGKGAVIVDAWQDLWFGGDVTIKGVEFAKGVSLNARSNNPCTITVEDCVIRWCDQKNDFLPEVDADPNFRIANSGNGLCLSIDTQNKGAKFLTVNVKNCTLIGDNDPTAPRKDSYKDTGDYKDNKDNEAFTNFKGRGNGVGLGTASGRLTTWKGFPNKTRYACRPVSRGGLRYFLVNVQKATPSWMAIFGSRQRETLREEGASSKVMSPSSGPRICKRSRRMPWSSMAVLEAHCHSGWKRKGPTSLYPMPKLAR